MYYQSLCWTFTVSQQSQHH